MSHQLPAGTILHGRYRIESVIGQGGFGITYKAHDPRLNQWVCIKELFPSGLCVRGPENTVVFQGKEALDFPGFRKRFIREAQELAKFRHPNIVRVSEVFEANQTAYFVMDFVEGETLRERVLREGRLQPEQALPLMHSLLDAVETVHIAGMLHRDIKPDNILVEPSGKVVLIDFGSAKSFEDGRTLSQTAILTPGYAPLEQYSDTAGRGPFTDIYALGATFYFMLTGRKPLAAIDRQENVLQPPHSVFSDISDILSSAIMLALNLRSADRFQSVAEFRRALNNSGRPAVRAPKPPNKPNPEPRLPKLPPIRKPYILLAALFILGLLGYRYWNSGPKAALLENTASNKDIVARSGDTMALPPAADPKPPTESAQPTSAPTEARNEVLQRLLKNMVYVQGGTFTMGCTDEQGSDCFDDEKPAHTVQLSSFSIGKYEVTQEEWEAVMGSNPSHFSNCPRCPVENVSWNNIQVFINALNRQTGRQFRLPTEAEWEYAARGGNRNGGHKYSGSDNIASVAWYDENSGSRTHPVGQKAANDLGLYDMSGNVWEWCSDWYGVNYYSNSLGSNPRGRDSGTNRVLRGGGWIYGAGQCRVTFRLSLTPERPLSRLGFRLVSPGL